MSVYIRLAGPAQSWAREKVSGAQVDTKEVPTFGGLAGLLAAALGMPHGVYPEWFKDLKINVRVDDCGEIFNAIQVVTARYTATGSVGDRFADKMIKTMTATPGKGKVKVPSERKQQPQKYQMTSDAARMTPVGAGNALTRRTYIGGATFLVEYVAPGRDEEILAALRNPVYSPYMGRKAFAPTFPFLLGSGSDGMLESLPSIGTGELEIHNLAFGEYPREFADSRVSVEQVGFDDWLGLISSELSLA